MSYCINPWCSDRDNSNREVLDLKDCCKTCGTPLLVQERYRLIRPLRELDEWEASEIFEVDDRGAIKVLKLLKQKIFQPQFEREAETLKRLEHLGIPRVDADGYFTLSVAGRQIFCLVMENIQGTNLDAWLEQHGTLDQTTALDWLRQLVELLSRLHKEELFHRDIKLSNIMLRPTGQLALIDFGTVRPMTSTYFAKVGGKRDITSVVSPGYTPLEQINGKAVPQSDFYALGRSMVYLLTGSHPVDLAEDETTGQLDWQQKLTRPVSDWFGQLLDEMMAPFPGQRPLNADVLLRRLREQRTTAAEKENKEQNQQVRWLVALNVSLLIFQLLVGWQWTRARSNRVKQIEVSTVQSISVLSQRPSQCPYDDGPAANRSANAA